MLPPTRVPGQELLVPGCRWPGAGGIKKHPTAHSSMCIQHRDSAGCAGCARSAAGWVSSWHQPQFPPQCPIRVRTRVGGAEGTHTAMTALRAPCPVQGAACPACPGSQCSSPPAHPSLSLWALQPRGLRVEGADSFPGGRFLSSGAVNYPQPVACNLSASPLCCLPGCRHSTSPTGWLHQGPTSGSCLCTSCSSWVPHILAASQGAKSQQG